MSVFFSIRIQYPLTKKSKQTILIIPPLHPYRHLKRGHWRELSESQMEQQVNAQKGPVPPLVTKGEEMNMIRIHPRDLPPPMKKTEYDEEEEEVDATMHQCCRCYFLY